MEEKIEEKKSLFVEGKHENLPLCVRLNPTVPPGGIVGATFGPRLMAVGTKDPDAETAKA